MNSLFMYMQKSNAKWMVCNVITNHLSLVYRLKFEIPYTEQDYDY